MTRCRATDGGDKKWCVHNGVSMTETEMRRALATKRTGHALDAATWRDIVAAHMDERVGDAQMAALLMACTLRGLSFDETFALTAAFVASGETLEAPDPRTVDKHSTGGVGDTASLIVVPLVAACGIPVAKLSGRALGHTGGTLEKLESIRGVRTDLVPERFFACVAEAGCAIAAAGARLVPADKRIYALRDLTATVGSLGLIGASIVSKKIAGGAHGIVFDVKSGRGALLADSVAARELAELLVALADAFGRPSRAIVTDMNEPLGPAIGTGLEALEARDFLRGTRRTPRLYAACIELAAAMLAVSGINGDCGAALAHALDSGAAYATFEAMLAAQGAERGALDALRPHDVATVVRATRSGFVAAIDVVALGELARELVMRGGTGAGIVVEARIGDALPAGDPLAIVYG
ncbi:MAG: thymidine phosphorylase, partial [Candidatus Eremiobacteraeota bacterium]|nr:thymidine phosphorylase [Candidatus Eremiobacteraeota bacterium]